MGFLSKLSVTSSPGIRMKFLACAEGRVEAVHSRQIVMVGEHQEVVTVPFVPADYICRSAVAVAMDGMRMRVSLYHISFA